MKKQIGLSLLAIWFLTSCSLPRPLNHEKLITKAYTATTEAKSFHFTIRGTIVTDKKVDEVSGEGDVVFPDRWQMSMTIGDQKMETIQFGKRLYDKPPGSAGWQVQELSSVSPTQSMNPQNTLEYLQFLDELRKSYDETVDGVKCECYSGVLNWSKYVATARSRIDLSNLQEKQALEAFEQLAQETNTAVEVCIGEEDTLIHQQRIVSERSFVPPLAPLPPSAPTPAKMTVTSTMTIKFSAFNNPVIIEPPLQD